MTTNSGRLLRAVQHDGLGGSVDWRLLRYTLAPEATRLLRGTRLERHPMLDPAARVPYGWDRLRGFTLTPALTRLRRGVPSSRRTVPEPGVPALEPAYALS